MDAKSTAAASTRGTTGTPATNPMNLTCTTKTAAGAAPDTAPSMVKIVIHSTGQAGPPGSGWLPFVDPDPNIDYELLDQSTDPPTTRIVNGAGVAIYYKE